jgi:drug/metabolite transporter (DMT)-like permease
VAHPTSTPKHSFFGGLGVVVVAIGAILGFVIGFVLSSSLVDAEVRGDPRAMLVTTYAMLGAMIGIVLFGLAVLVWRHTRTKALSKDHSSNAQ